MSAKKPDDQAQSSLEATPESEHGKASSAPPSFLKKQWSEFHWRAHALAPSLIPHPNGGDRDDTAHDPKENEASRIDPDRELRSPMFWGVEIYGPAEVSSLYAGLKKLGWSRAGGWSRDHNSVSQIRRMRSHGAGSSVNLGFVSQRGGDASRFRDNNFADLPDGVEFLIVTASQITPSLTAIAIGFQMEERVAQRYEAELNKDRQTIHRRIPGTWSIEWASPAHQKQRAVDTIRRERRAMVGAWFKRNLPGYFCGLKLGWRFPTMELLVARGLTMCEDGQPSVSGFGSWQRLLMNASPYELWDSSEYPGLQMAFDWHHDKDTGRHLYLTLDPNTFPDNPHEGYGAPSMRAFSLRCDRTLTSLFGQLAALEYLKVHAQDLHVARERLKSARASSSDVAKTLKEISRFFDKTLGAPAIVRELAEYSEHERWFRRSCGDFGTDAWQDDGVRTMLYSGLQSSFRSRATRLTEDEASLRTHFEQLTTILSVQESIRLQRWTLLLTIVALAAAFGSLAIALYGPPSS